jgi:glycosyltransferase involved in cell wall biosynthesis
MKIAIVSSGHIPSHFAHSINTVKHADAFAKLGHDVELLIVKRYQESKMLSKIKSIYEWYGVDELPIKFFKDKSLFYWHEKKPYTRILNGLNRLTSKKFQSFLDPEKKISKYIKENDFDLCFARSYRVVKNNIQNKIPTIMETHNPTPEKVKDLMDVIKLSQSKYLKGIVTIHQKLKDNFVRLGVPELKVLVLEDAVDLDKYDQVSDDAEYNRTKLNLPLDKKIVMYCGSLKPGKGIHIILETAKKLENRNDILFYIVGGKNDEVEYWKNYKNQDYLNVVFTGFVEGSFVPQYLKSADVLFMPYDKSEKNMVMDINTTSPIKLFEYMAAKKPIVTTKIEVIEKILKHNESGVVVENNYSQAIVDLLSNIDLMIKLSDNACQLVQDFTYKKRCEQILKGLV